MSAPQGFDVIPGREWMAGYRATATDGTVVEIVRVDSCPDLWAVFVEPPTGPKGPYSAPYRVSQSEARHFGRQVLAEHGGPNR